MTSWHDKEIPLEMFSMRHSGGGSSWSEGLFPPGCAGRQTAAGYVEMLHAAGILLDWGLLFVW